MRQSPSLESLWPLMLLLCFTLIFSAAGDDLVALAALYNSTNGPHWTSHCRWPATGMPTCTSSTSSYGVTCSSDRVIRISLNNCNITGTLPHQWSILSALRNIQLEFNQLTGTLPDQWSSMSALQDMRLYYNRLSYLSCRKQDDGKEPAVGVSVAVSVFLQTSSSDPFLAAAVGNLCLLAAALAANAAICAVVAWRSSVSFTEAAGGVSRFPAMTINAALLLLPGSVFGGVAVLAGSVRGTSPASAAAGSAVCVVLVCSLVAGAQLHLYRNVLPATQWELYLQRPMGEWDSVLYPLGRWAPKRTRNQFGPLIGPMKRRFALYRVVDVVQSLVIAAAAGAGGGAGGVVCTTLVVTVAVVSFVFAGFCAATRPFRLPFERAAVPLHHALMGVVCSLKAAGDSIAEDVVAALGLLQTTVLLVKVVLGLWVSFREARWEDEASDDTGGSRDSSTLSEVLRTLAGTLWFGGGGIQATEHKAFEGNTFTRLAVSDLEELADSLPGDELRHTAEENEVLLEIPMLAMDSSGVVMEPGDDSGDCTAAPDVTAPPWAHLRDEEGDGLCTGQAVLQEQSVVTEDYFNVAGPTRTLNMLEEFFVAKNDQRGRSKSVVSQL